MVDGIIEAFGGTTESNESDAADPPMKLVRDPVCGTWVSPASRSAFCSRRSTTHYFCSDECRSEVSEPRMSTRVEEQLRAEIVEAGRRMYARGYVASNDGNISARLDDVATHHHAEERLEGLHDART